MSWKTPKTDYNTIYVPGPSDLNRIEENTAFLKAYIETDGLFVLPSNTIIMSANTERGGYNFSGVAKKFRVKYEGKYRIECEAKRNGFETASLSCGGSHSLPNDGQYHTYVGDIYVPAGEIIVVSVSYTFSQSASNGYLYLKNARVKGTLMTRSQVPANAVLQD